MYGSIQQGRCILKNQFIIYENKLNIDNGLVNKTTYRLPGNSMWRQIDSKFKINFYISFQSHCWILFLDVVLAMELLFAADYFAKFSCGRVFHSFITERIIGWEYVQPNCRLTRIACIPNAINTNLFFFCISNSNISATIGGITIGSYRHLYLIHSQQNGSFVYIGMA